jgi:hypothetical protein
VIPNTTYHGNSQSGSKYVVYIPHEGKIYLFLPCNKKDLGTGGGTPMKIHTMSKMLVFYLRIRYTYYHSPSCALILCIILFFHFPQWSLSLIPLIIIWLLCISVCVRYPHQTRYRQSIINSIIIIFLHNRRIICGINFFGYLIRSFWSHVILTTPTHISHICFTPFSAFCITANIERPHSLLKVCLLYDSDIILIQRK